MSVSTSRTAPAGRVRRPSRAEVRRRLLDAARAALIDRGYGDASVDAITEAAGLSRGALYSNFADKEDLYLTLLEEMEREQISSIAALRDGDVSVADLVSRVATRRPPQNHDPRAQVILQTELWLLGTRNAKVRRRLVAIQRRTVDAIASTLGGDHLGLTPQEVGLVVNALADGLLMQRITDPRGQRDGLLLAVLASLASLGTPAADRG